MNNNKKIISLNISNLKIIFYILILDNLFINLYKNKEI